MSHHPACLQGPIERRDWLTSNTNTQLPSISFGPWCLLYGFWFIQWKFPKVGQICHFPFRKTPSYLSWNGISYYPKRVKIPWFFVVDSHLVQQPIGMTSFYPSNSLKVQLLTKQSAEQSFRMIHGSPEFRFHSFPSLVDVCRLGLPSQMFINFQESLQ